ncbi:uncharacterized protein L201_006495 [Kwoniella dendrophila CBS 6074]|uniref:Protein ZIP4 homolog n=1 Tax=Kwoniella dendrophila CBS 6074 TaxID=1295534 RepID=A0AAX4K2Z8_9TREE
MSDQREKLRGTIRSLHPLLDDLSQHYENDTPMNYGTLNDTLDNVRVQVEVYSKGKSKKKNNNDNTIGEKEKERDLKQEMDELGVKIWNLTNEFSPSISSNEKKKEQNVLLIASLYHVSFRLIQASADSKSSENLIRLLRAVSTAISALALSGQSEKAEELAHIGAEYQQSIDASQPDTAEEKREKSEVFLHFQLARVDLEVLRKNDNLALSLLIKATQSEGGLEAFQYQELASKCWSISQEILSRGDDTKKNFTFTTAPIEWLQQAQSIMEKAVEQGIHIPGANDVRIAISTNIAREQIKNVSEDPQALVKATATLKQLAKAAASTVMFKDLSEFIDWNDETVLTIIAQLHAVSADYPETPIIVSLQLLNRALTEQSGFNYVDRILYEGVYFARQHLVKNSQDNRQQVLSMLEGVVKSGFAKSLDSTRVIAVQMIFTNIAHRQYEARGQFQQAAEWYCLAAHPALDAAGPSNTFRCMRKAANCYINLGNLGQADGLLQQCPPRGAATQYLSFIIGIQQSDTAKAIQAIEALMVCPDLEADHLTLLMEYVAEKRGPLPILTAALQALLVALDRPEMREELKFDKLTVVRCLLQSLISGNTESTEKQQLGDQVIEHLDHEGLGEFPARVLADLFDRSAQLSSWYTHLNPTEVDLDTEKISASAMFACFAGKMFQYRELNDAEGKQTLREQLLQYYDTVHVTLRENSKIGSSDQMIDVLEVYRLELLCDVGMWDEVGNTVFIMGNLPLNSVNGENSTRKLEMVINLILNYTDCPAAIVHRVLEILVGAISVISELDVVKFSRWIRGIIMLLLQRSGPNDHKQAQSYLSRCLQLLATPLGQSAYPPDEMQWLIATSWNKGLELYYSSRYEEGKSWCELCLKLAANMLPNTTQLDKLKTQYHSLVIPEVLGNTTVVNQTENVGKVAQPHFL